jgi:hypothetical protein
MEDSVVELEPLRKSRSGSSVDLELEIQPEAEAKYQKVFILVLACTFSIGSHYSQDCIGPLKDVLQEVIVQIDNILLSDYL